MKRLFDLGKKKKHKKKLTPSAVAGNSPAFQYARNEYAQTVATGTSNDDGRGVLFVASPHPRLLQESDGATLGDPESQIQSNSAVDSRPSFSSPVAMSQQEQQQQQHLGLASVASARSNSGITTPQMSYQTPNASGLRSFDDTPHPNAQPIFTSPVAAASTPHADKSQQQRNPSTLDFQSSSMDQQHPPPTTTDSLYANVDDNSPMRYSQDTPKGNNRNGGMDHRHPNLHHRHANASLSDNIPFDYTPAIMPDATYEEEYGDAYTGGPIKYVYPSGYQSMRPRSGPWKLSIIIFFLFTWLSVFIVGHCSDRVDYNQYYQYEIDDDIVVIETRWCGSRVLYLMWVISMLVTGLAAAYCSVIGYIKVRDFGVANNRSQPPGAIGKSDFYVQITDDCNAGTTPIIATTSSAQYLQNYHNYGNAAPRTDVSNGSNNSSAIHVPIYQSDGMPQFWGTHIYRPTQAAVAITSR